MKKIILFMLSALLFANCSDIDNYDAPNSSIKGGIYDLSTKGLANKLPVHSQSPNGTRIKLFEGEYTQPIIFWCNTDGSFQNTRVFAGNYKIIPEGPFLVEPDDTIRVSIPSREPIEFYVEPFLRINIRATLNGENANTSFTIKKSNKWKGTLNQYVILYSWTKNVDANNYTYRKIVDVSQESEVLGTEQSESIPKIDMSRPVFIRIAARTTGTNYYNYSEIIQLK